LAVRLNTLRFWLSLCVEKSIKREEMQESFDMQADRASTPVLVI